MALEADTFLEFAKSSINDFGADVILRQKSGESYDPASGDLSSTKTNYNTKGLIENFNEKFIADGLAKTGDRKVILAASNLIVAPQQGNKLIIASVEFDVIAVKADFFAGEAIIYTLHARA